MLKHPDGLRQKLVFELNRSGLYVSMQEQLRSCVDAIGKEKFDCSSREQMIPFCSRLYGCMVDEMHSWLKHMTGQTIAGQPVPPGKVLQLASLASECELLGDAERAMRIHEERFVYFCCQPPMRLSNSASYFMRASASAVHFKSIQAVGRRHMCGMVLLGKVLLPARRCGQS